MKKAMTLWIALCLTLAGVTAAQAEEAPANILIAYFTWANNTVVSDPTSVDVDASTSASVLSPGNTAIMAGYIHELVGGDLFSIVVKDAYPSDYDDCLDRAADELDAGTRPALKGTLPSVEQYDTIYLGFPNWWYTIPMAIHTFISEHALSGKTIVPFCAHGTAGLAGTIRDLTSALPENCVVLEPLGVYRPDIATSQPVIEAWLDGLGRPGVQ